VLLSKRGVFEESSVHQETGTTRVGSGKERRVKRKGGGKKARRGEVKAGKRNEEE
jgi:hypothetical protein